MNLTDTLNETNSNEDKSDYSTIPKFICPIMNCNAAYKKQWLLDDHVRKHNKERPFKCNIDDCTKSFTKEPHLKRHKIMVHERSCELECDIKGCGRFFNNKYSLKKHKNQVHNTMKWPFFCNQCSIGFKKKWQLNQHNFKHTGEPPFKCNYCNIRFTIQRDLTKHSRNHKTYTCECSEIFQRWSTFILHKKTCSTQNIVSAYTCDTCKKSFAKKENLTAHINSVHTTSNDTYKCPYLDCERSYKYKKNLNFHIKFYHLKKMEKLPCPKCKLVFSQQFYLNRHIKIVHEQIKIPKPRAPRKDKGKTKTYTAAVLTGLKLSQSEHKKHLKKSEKKNVFNENDSESANKNAALNSQSNESNLKESVINSHIIEKQSTCTNDSIRTVDLIDDEIITACNVLLNRVEKCLA